MERKVKLSLRPAGIVGIVFSCLGAIYLCVGIGVSAFGTEEDSRIAGLVFLVLAGGFLVSGVILGILELCYRQRLCKVISAGRSIWGEVADVVQNPHVRINDRMPYNLLVRYTDAQGQIHLFRSENLYTYPDRSVIGKQVRVYVEYPLSKYYYVDLQGVLPNVIEH